MHSIVPDARRTRDRRVGRARYWHTARGWDPGAAEHLADVDSPPPRASGPLVRVKIARSRRARVAPLPLAFLDGYPQHPLVDAARQQQDLHDAIESRQVVGQAIGLLRAKSKLSNTEAFDLFANASQRTNLDMRDLAQQISDGTRTGNEP
jgi:ANTAR domain